MVMVVVNVVTMGWGTGGTVLDGTVLVENVLWAV